jgi:hypothetical protein
MVRNAQKLRFGNIFGNIGQVSTGVLLIFARPTRRGRWLVATARMLLLRLFWPAISRVRIAKAPADPVPQAIFERLVIAVLVT